MTHVWLENPETGGKAAFPAEAVGVWRAHGWIDTDPAPEPDLLHDPPVAAADEAANEGQGPDGAAPPEDVADIGEQGQDESTRPSRRGKRGPDTEE